MVEVVPHPRLWLKWGCIGGGGKVNFIALFMKARFPSWVGGSKKTRACELSRISVPHLPHILHCASGGDCA